MVCAFRDVPHAEAEQTEEANRAYAETKVGPSICVSRLCNATCLLIVQLIERLLFIATFGRRCGYRGRAEPGNSPGRPRSAFR